MLSRFRKMYSFIMYHTSLCYDRARDGCSPSALRVCQRFAVDIWKDYTQAFKGGKQPLCKQVQYMTRESKCCLPPSQLNSCVVSISFCRKLCKYRSESFFHMGSGYRSIVMFHQMTRRYM